MSNEFLSIDRPTKKIKSEVFDRRYFEHSDSVQETLSCDHSKFSIAKFISTARDHDKLSDFSTQDYTLMLSEYKAWPKFNNSLKEINLKEVITLEQTIQDQLFSISQAHYKLIDTRTALKNELSTVIEKEEISKNCFKILSEKLDNIVGIKKELLKSTISDFNYHCKSTNDSITEHCFSPTKSAPVLLSEASTSTKDIIDSKIKDPPEPTFSKLHQSNEFDILGLQKAENKSISLLDSSNTRTNNKGISLFVGEYKSYSNGKSILAMKIFSNSLFVASANWICYRFDISSGNLVCTFSGHKHPVTCLEISVNKQSHQKRLYTGSSDKTIRCYDILTANCLCIFTFEAQIMCLSIHSNILFVGLSSGVMPCVNVVSNKLICRSSHHKPKAISFIYSSKYYLYTGSFDASIGIYDIRSCVANSNSESSCILIKQIKNHSGAILCLQIRGDILYSGSVDRTVVAFDISRGVVANRFLGHTLPVSSIQVYLTMLITACLDKKVRVFNLKTSELLQTYIGYSHQLFSMIFKKNILYTGCKNGKLFSMEIDLNCYYQCLWSDCELRLGNIDQLRMHIVEDHIDMLINNNLTICGWGFCQELFSHRSLKEKRMHILSHIQNVQPEYLQNKIE